MRKLWTVTKREYLERVRSRWFLIATVFGPLLFGGLMFLPAYFASRSSDAADVSRVRVIDATGSNVGLRIASELGGGLTGDTTRTRLVVVAPSEIAQAESLATAAVIQKEIRGYLVLDDDALQGLDIRYAGTNATAIADMNRIESVVRKAIMAYRLEAAGVSAADATTLSTLRPQVHAERITATGRGGSGRVNLLFAITVAMLLYTTIFIYGQNVLRGVMEEKQTRVAEVVVSSVSPGTLLAGKVLGVGAVGLTQMLVWMGSSILLFRLRGPILAKFGITSMPFQLPSITPGMLGLLLLFFVLGYVLYSAMFAAVGAMVSTEQDAQQAQMPVVLLLVMSVMFLQTAISEPDGRMATNLSWLPFSAPIVMPLRLATVNVPAWDIFTSLAILAATCYLCVYAAARIYRTGLLLYGKRPSFMEVMRWVVRSR
jgi:ABC-2 type transport system permease protein